MNLCIDRGNSSTKVGIFNDDTLSATFSFTGFDAQMASELISEYRIDSCILSNVAAVDNQLVLFLRKHLQLIIELSHDTPVPIENRYATPQTLGKDRLAAVIGASHLKPGTDLLVIDAGTAITYDFIDASGVYLGGNIAPGLDLRLRALHEFTQRLPLIEAKADSPMLGIDTASAIASGALYGIVYEIDGYIYALKDKYPGLSTFLTGGSTFYFDNKLKNAIFAERNLVLIGLNRILKYNEQK